jgi:hypothetical protein
LFITWWTDKQFWNLSHLQPVIRRYEQEMLESFIHRFGGQYFCIWLSGWCALNYTQATGFHWTLTFPPDIRYMYIGFLVVAEEQAIFNSGYFWVASFVKDFFWVELWQHHSRWVVVEEQAIFNSGIFWFANFLEDFFRVELWHHHSRWVEHRLAF